MNDQRNHSLATVLVVLALFAAACSPTVSPDPARDAEGYVQLTVEELAGMLEEKDFVLVNVHIPYEGEIPQTDLFIPFDEIGDRLNELPGRDGRIVLYCRSGSMSTTAARVLVALGYTNVYEVSGGMQAWEAAGHELIREGRQE
jgi:rhodanese-related sulfurtransferase